MGKWQPTPVFFPGESQKRGSLLGCCLWGRTESDTTEVTQQQVGLIQKDLMEKGVLRLGLRRLQSFSNEGTRTSLGVQISWRSSGYASGLPMQEVPFQRLVIESISCIQCSTGIKKIKCKHLCDKGCELHSGWKMI